MKSYHKPLLFKTNENKKNNLYYYVELFNADTLLPLSIHLENVAELLKTSSTLFLKRIVLATNNIT